MVEEDRFSWKEVIREESEGGLGEGFEEGKEQASEGWEALAKDGIGREERVEEPKGGLVEVWRGWCVFETRGGVVESVKFQARRALSDVFPKNSQGFSSFLEEFICLLKALS